MRGMRRFLAGVAGFVAVGLASPALAQDRTMYELAPIDVDVMALANVLHDEVVALYETPERWKEAAELHLEAAESARGDAVAAFGGFDRAARLFFYVGEFGQARQAMEEALDIALATGDVVTSAHVAIDVAFIANREGYGGKKREAVRLARELAASTLVTDVDRADILVRIEGGADGSVVAGLQLVPRRLVLANLPASSL